MKKSLLAGIAASTLLAVTPALSDGHLASENLAFKPGEDDRFSWDSYEELKKLDLSGETVTISGPWTGPDADLVNKAFDYFEAATGAKVEYTGSDGFEQQIVIEMQAGSAPNIAVFPQPGLAADSAAKGFLTPLGEETANWVKENYAAGESWANLSTYKGKDGKEAMFVFPYKIDVKSLVWYVPENFEEAGYEVPETMEELKALTDQIVADGGTPWCIGLGSGGATGWPATDWVEDLLLRTATPDVYDKWVTNEVPFNDPQIVAAIEEFGHFAKNDKYVDGGAAAVGSTDFRDSPKGMFASPPKCYMHHQATFIPTFFPEGTELGTDADFFYFPAYGGKDLGKPVLGAGTMLGITKDSKAAQEFIKFLQSPIAHEVWMAQGGFLTPHKGAKLEAYPSDSVRKQGEILTNSTVFRFDGSDLMPGKIGAGAFWTGMVDFVGGKDAKTVADEIQTNWDALK